MTATSSAPASAVRVLAPLGPGYDTVLTSRALEFVAALERRFRLRRARLLRRRELVQRRFDAGWRPSFPARSAALRAAEWRVAPIPPDLDERRVEITGPVDRKMIINALNSGADVFMADFEDSTAPTWRNVVEGQIHLRDAVRRTIEFLNPANAKHYRLGAEVATLVVRPRGWHLDEVHVQVDGRPVSASIFDFALYLFHNARELSQRGTGPYFYLPKLESRLEARLWNQVIVAAQDMLAIPPGTVRATVLIETLPAAFEMDEILWELREHSAGLNCGRWDYIFSFVKCFRADPSCVLPDRGTVTMEQHFLRSYSRHLVRTCHRRGIHAMGGMAAQIPIRGDEEANAGAIDKVRRDKRREVEDGHDGTWVAHPGLVGVAREEFDAAMPGPNQIERACDVEITAADLLCVPRGPITERGLRQNLEVGVRYLAAWLCGEGCVPIHHLMEDAATAEISRTQVWQQIRHGARLDDGRVVTAELVERVLAEEVAAIREAIGGAEFHARRFDLAARLFAELVTATPLPAFLTTLAYPHIA